jgi:predicted DNA-binding protein
MVAPKCAPRNKLIGTYLPPEMIGRLDALAAARHGIPKAVLFREAVELLLEKAELDAAKEEHEKRQHRAAIEALMQVVAKASYSKDMLWL